MATPCVVTANFEDSTGAALQGNSFLRFRLRNFAGNVPLVTGTAIVVETQLDVFPNGSGLISTNLWGNDSISPTGTFWTCEFWNNGRITSQQNYLITGASFNLNSAPPINPPPAASGPCGGLPSGGLTGQVLTKNSNTSCDASWQAVSAPFGGPRPSLGNWHGITMSPHTTVITNNNAYGTNPTTGGGTVTAIRPTATEPAYLIFPTAANVGGGDIAYLQDNGGMNDGVNKGSITLGILAITEYRVIVPILANARAYVGFGDQHNSENAMRTDSIGSTGGLNFCGFRYSTSAGDTTWKCVTANAVSQTIVDSGVTVSATVGAVLAIKFNGTNVLFFINGVQVASIATTVPTTSTKMGNICFCDNINQANSIQIAVAYSYWCTTV